MIYQKPVRAREVIAKSISHLVNGFGFIKDVGGIMFAINIARLPPSLQEGLLRVAPNDLRYYAASFIEAGGDALRDEVVAGRRQDEPAKVTHENLESGDELQGDDMMKWEVTKGTSIPPMIALRALCRAVFLDSQVNDKEISAMWSFVMCDEFLIAFNRLGMMHMLAEIVFQWLDLHSSDVVGAHISPRRT